MCVCGAVIPLQAGVNALEFLPAGADGWEVRIDPASKRPFFVDHVHHSTSWSLPKPISALMVAPNTSTDLVAADSGAAAALPSAAAALNGDEPSSAHAPGAAGAPAAAASAHVSAVGPAGASAAPESAPAAAAASALDDAPDLSVFTSSPSITFLVNRKKASPKNFPPTESLLTWLRANGHTDVKAMCLQGGCGACTVTLSYPDPVSGQAQNVSVNSCLRPLASVNGMSVTTCKGIGNEVSGFHPIQMRLADNNGSQCGMCSPGHVMTMYSLLMANPFPTPQQVEDQFDGNLCRCTGYRPILTSMQTFAVNPDAASPAPPKTMPDPDYLAAVPSSRYSGVVRTLPVPAYEALAAHHMAPKVGPLESVAASHTAQAGPLVFRGPSIYTGEKDVAWYAPTTVAQVFAVINATPAASRTFVVGNTSTGVYPYAAGKAPLTYVDLLGVSALHTTTVGASSLVVGSTVSINALQALLLANAERSSSFGPLVEHIQRVANNNVRNIASWTGNLMLVNLNDNFPSDMYTGLQGASVTLQIASSPSSIATYTLEQFATLNMSNKLIISMTIPYLGPAVAFNAYKVMQRHVNCHAYVNAAFQVQLAAGVVTGAPVLVYGGVLAKTVRASKTEAYLVGKNVTSPATLAAALALLNSELTANQAQGNVAYRQSLITALFYKFYLTLLPASLVPPDLNSVVNPWKRPVSGGMQSFRTDPSEYPVSYPISKLTSKLQCSGEAVFTDDVRASQGTVYGAFVLSTIGVGTLLSIDASEALAYPGVHAVFTADDIPSSGSNAFFPGEVIFVPMGGSIGYNGQALAFVVADTQDLAVAAAQLVKPAYANVGVPVTSIEEAIAKQMFLPNDITPIVQGDVNAEFATCDYVLENSASVPSQYHFYMELQTAFVEPTDGNWLECHVATQWPAMTQGAIAAALGLPNNDININVRRVGGGYGGKIAKCNQIACATALAAYLLQRPCKTVLDIYTNMRMVGRRFAHLAQYKVGFMSTGVIKAVQMTHYIDCGYTNNGFASGSLLWCDSAYNIAAWNVQGVNVQTNTAANTACRSPGSLPSTFMIQSIIELVATTLNMDAAAVAQANLYQQGDVTPYGDTLTYCDIGEITTDLLASASYSQRVAAVQRFNAANRYVKRGIALVPNKFGIGLAGNPFGCNVSVNTADGSIVVQHSGTEIGQGINVKVAQCVSLELGIPFEIIRVIPTTTNSIANAGVTGGSIGSELNCQAAILAAQQLAQRLAPVSASLQAKAAAAGTGAAGSGSAGASVDWLTLINAAYAAGVNLTSNAWFYSQPVASPFNYNSYEATCAEVQLDVLTGETTILRYDVLFDCGISLNPAIDLGQVEGALTFGIGYWLTEELQYEPGTGRLVTDSTWTYKPPSSKDIPVDLRISLLKDAPNPAGVLSSKACGEPPLAASNSIFFAVKQAMYSARAAAGTSGYFTLYAPATPSQVQQNSGVSWQDFSF